jgi:hypothetical protein
MMSAVNGWSIHGVEVSDHRLRHVDPVATTGCIVLTRRAAAQPRILTS